MLVPPVIWGHHEGGLPPSPVRGGVVITAGVNLVLDPVADVLVAGDAFSDDPARAAQLSEAAAEGPADVGLGPDDLAGALALTITRTLLRGTLRFGGVAASDDLASLTIATGESRARVAVDALRAGIDLLYVPDPAQHRRVYDAIVAATRSDRLPAARLHEAAARLHEAAARVLELKRAAG